MMKKKTVLSCVVLLLLTTNTDRIKAQNTDKQNFEISKNLEIFNALFKELNSLYVDSIKVESIIQTGIDAMLASLDPYTEYYPENKVSDLNFIATGEYAGIGAIITQREGKIYIAEPYEGMPAAKHGLEAGDELLEIDGLTLKGMNTTEVSNKLKGQANTILKIKYLRQGVKKPTSINVKRAIVHINPVTYYGVIEGSKVGYIYLSMFTNEAAAQVKSAFEEMKKEQHIESLIIDLRNNGGGVMEDAVQLVNIFVPKGELIVSTKGRIKQRDRMYRTSQKSIDENVPLVVITNRGSASSSEIVAGALQDLDRAVIIGQRTFGKGLVQSASELPYNGSLKVTTNKYYIPSGRCIQAIDYKNRNSDGSVGIIPDSLTNVFYTSKGRPVKDGGGIKPDINIDEGKMSNIVYYLLTEYTISDFATQWKQKNKEIAPIQKFALSEQDYQDFKDFVKSKEFTYDRQSEKGLKNLKEMMEFEDYLSTSTEEIAALEEKLKPNLDRDLDKYKEEIIKQISLEIAKRYYFQKGEIIQSLKNDKVLDKAIQILDDKEQYKSILSKQEEIKTEE
ncbi:peptidase S41 [Bacteroidales bacterium]|nr:peptidase S41 [Bacteroidales bacterium]